MLGERLGESRGRIIGARVLPSEAQQVWMEVSFQGHGTLLGQEINDTGTYRQTVRPGGVLYGEGHVLMMSTAGDIVDWVGGGVGRPTGPGYQASYGVWGSAQTTSKKLARLGQVADVIEYEVEEDGSYRWTMWEWTDDVGAVRSWGRPAGVGRSHRRRGARRHRSCRSSGPGQPRQPTWPGCLG
jgi:hypothetical protein